MSGQSLNQLGFINATIAIVLVAFALLMQLSQCSLEEQDNPFEIVGPCPHEMKYHCTNVTCTLPEQCKDEATAKANHYKILPPTGCRTRYSCCKYCSKLMQENEPCNRPRMGVYTFNGFCDEGLECDFVGDSSKCVKVKATAEAQENKSN